MIRAYRDANGYSPTIADIQKHFGIRSTNGVVDHLVALEKKHAIRRQRRRARSIVVLDPADAAR